tara:strand:+ start:238 stop:747 length:510 start_codon:yes stop_codon:yes gene_type:complete
MEQKKQIESITIPYNKVPNESLQSELRHAMETQFRYKFYQDIQFPYLQSLGIKNVLQGFGNEEVGFIGILHLWWVNEDNNIVYEKPRETPVQIKGMWKSEWLNDPKEAIALAQKIEDEKCYDESKLVEIGQKFIQQKMQKQAEQQLARQIQEKQENEWEEKEEKPILLN